MQYRGRKLNQDAYQAMKAKLARQFPRGHFVAISRGELVANAPSFDELTVILEGLGLDPRKTLIAQAGISPPQHVVIFL